MKIEKITNLKYEIEVGDLITPKHCNIGKYYLLLYKKSDYVLDGGDNKDYDLEFPFILLDLQNGLMDDAYCNLDEVIGDYELVAKNENITLSY